MLATIKKITENGLNIAGLSVLLLVSGLSVLNEYGSDQWLVIASLVLAIPLLFVLFIVTDDYEKQRLLFSVQGALMTVSYFLVNNSFTAIFSIVWIVQASELFTKRIAVALLIGSAALYTISLFYHLGTENIFDPLVTAASFGLFQVFAYAASQRAIHERLLKEEAAGLNRELLATRELLSQSAAQSERIRISRDLHDILGHHMTALILNLEVANHKTEGDAKDKVQQSLSLAKLLLGDIRSAVGELRDDDSIYLEQSIIRLTDGIPNIEFEINFESAPEVKSMTLAETLLRCTQESITNVLKHSDANYCLIQLRQRNDQCILQVEDNGGMDKHFVIGNGITGMKERIHALNGKLSCSQENSGFKVRIEIPLSSAL